MPIEIDFEGVSVDGGFAPLEPGVYEGVITSCKQGQSQAGKPKIETEVTLSDTNNRKVWINYSLQPNALWKLKQDLMTLGYDIPEGRFEFEPADLLQQPVRVTIVQKPHWQDASKMVEEVEKIEKSEGVSW